MTPAYLGLDAGSSTTVALVADATGTILGRGPRATASAAPPFGRWWTPTSAWDPRPR